MFRLIKLAAYALLGYAIYEFVLGMSHGEPAGERYPESEPSPAPRQQGGSQSVTTHDPDGLSATHCVGRGVVTR